MPLLTLLLNLLWLVFGGIWMALAWLIAAVIMAVTNHRTPLGAGGPDDCAVHPLAVRPHRR